MIYHYIHKSKLSCWWYPFHCFLFESSCYSICACVVLGTHFCGKPPEQFYLAVCHGRETNRDFFRLVIASTTQSAPNATLITAHSASALDLLIRQICTLVRTSSWVYSPADFLELANAVDSPTRSDMRKTQLIGSKLQTQHYMKACQDRASVLVGWTNTKVCVGYWVCQYFLIYIDLDRCLRI